MSLTDINGSVEHCQSIDELRVQLPKYEASSRVIACTAAKITELTPILNAISIDALYILNLGNGPNHSVEPWWDKVTVVYTEKQLMRHISTKAMLCFNNEGLEHRENGDHGLANACFLDALQALDCAAKFI